MIETRASSAVPGVVSLLIPLYRHEHTVERTLDSLLDSDTSCVELLVCDDASPDQSLAVARAWMDRHARRFHRAELLVNPVNLGITGNLNRLVQASRGEYVSILASDDELAPRAIDVQIDHLRRRADHDFVFGNVALIDPEGRMVQDKVVCDRRARFLRNGTICLVDLVFVWGLPWTRLFGRRDAFVRFGPYLDEHSIEDRWSALKIAQTRRFGYLHDVVLRYRLRPGGGTGGLEQALVLRDMFDVERRLLPHTTGLLRALLTIRDRSFRRPGTQRLDRPFWWLVRRILDATHRFVAGA